MATLTIELPPHRTQTNFNMRRWAELLADRELARFEGRIETDRYGHVIMGPPLAPTHGSFQSEIAYLLRTFMPRGRVLTECPISTADGVKAALGGLNAAFEVPVGARTNAQVTLDALVMRVEVDARDRLAPLVAQSTRVVPLVELALRRAPRPVAQVGGDARTVGDATGSSRPEGRAGSASQRCSVGDTRPR